MPALGYREHPPPPALAAAVECFWTTHEARDRPRTGVQRVVPDGCIDLIFDLGSEPCGRFVGTMTRTLLVPRGGPADFLGVRFHPGAAAPLLGCEAEALTDRSAPLELLWPAGQVLPERLASLPWRARMPALSQALGRALEQRRSADLVVRAAVQLLRAGTQPSLRELQRRLGYSERQIERRFKREVGLSPKRLARVLRFRRALERLRAADAPPLSALALELGFADQAHLSRELRALAGAPPSALRGGP